MQLPQIIPVTRGGAKIGWEYLFDALESAYFVAVDTEFSGLGDVKLLYGNCISEKYDGLKQLVSNRAIFSVGFSIFSVADTCLGKKSGKLLKERLTFYYFLVTISSYHLQAQPFCNKDYQLLKIYKTAILERNENTKRSSGEKKKSKKRRKKENSELFLSLSKAEEREPTRKSSLLSILPLGLLAHLGQADIPIILHNGLLDLAFLYSSFEENLPKTSEEFVRNLHQLLPCIYDTKLLSSDGENETSLDTVYQLCVSWNQKRKSENETFIQCWNPENNPDHRETAPNPHFEGKTPEIDSFSAKSDEDIVPVR
ncbi:Target of EGR1 protein 1 [Galdieria sulphuraria]|nr:Target of EGR1 protein 1 [Galdieria sulphuraria]